MFCIRLAFALRTIWNRTARSHGSSDSCGSEPGMGVGGDRHAWSDRRTHRTRISRWLNLVLTKPPGATGLVEKNGRRCSNICPGELHVAWSRGKDYCGSRCDATTEPNLLLKGNTQFVPVTLKFVGGEGADGPTVYVNAPLSQTELVGRGLPSKSVVNVLDRLTPVWMAGLTP